MQRILTGVPYFGALLLLIPGLGDSEAFWPLTMVAGATGAFPLLSIIPFCIAFGVPFVFCTLFMYERAVMELGELGAVELSEVLDYKSKK